MFNEITNCAAEAALNAGKILREGFRQDFKVSSKDGINNLVTEYDHRSEEYIIDYIKKRFSGHTFLAEESGGAKMANDDSYRWIIDPLDGTVNFARRLPIFSVSIAAEYDGEIVSGVVYHPILDELFIAEKGKGAYMNGKKISVNENGDLRVSFLVTGFPYNVDENPGGCIDHFVDIIKNGIPIRRLGSAALDLAYVAAGIFDGFWEVELHPWDVAAGMLLVKEAGGRITQYDGSEYHIRDNNILATNGRIHNDVINSFKELNCSI